MPIVAHFLILLLIPSILSVDTWGENCFTLYHIKRILLTAPLAPMGRHFRGNFHVDEGDGRQLPAPPPRVLHATQLFEAGNGARRQPWEKHLPVPFLAQVICTSDGGLDNGVVAGPAPLLVRQIQAGKTAKSQRMLSPSAFVLCEGIGLARVTKKIRLLGTLLYGLELLSLRGGF